MNEIDGLNMRWKEILEQLKTAEDEKKQELMDELVGIDNNIKKLKAAEEKSKATEKKSSGARGVGRLILVLLALLLGISGNFYPRGKEIPDIIDFATVVSLESVKNSLTGRIDEVESKVNEIKPGKTVRIGLDKATRNRIAALERKVKEFTKQNGKSDTVVKQIKKTGKEIEITVITDEDISCYTADFTNWKEIGPDSVSRAGVGTRFFNAQSSAGLWAVNKATLRNGGTENFSITLKGPKNEIHLDSKKQVDNKVGGANYQFEIKPDGTLVP